MKDRFDALPTGGPDDIDAYCTTWDDTVRWRMARYLASAIVTYRYGKDGVPGSRGIENHALGHRPDSLYWPGVWDTQDIGVAPPGDFWGTVSAAAADRIDMVVLDYNNVASATPTTLVTAAPLWADDEHVGHIVTAIDSLGTGFQSRLVKDNTADTLYLFDNWTTTPDNTYTYVIQTHEDFWRADVWKDANLWLATNPNRDSMIGFNPVATRKDGNWRKIAASSEDDRLSGIAPVWAADVPQPGDTFMIASLDAGTATSAKNLPVPPSLTDGTKSWDSNKWERCSVRITGGTGAGQVRLIMSNTGDTLNVGSDWAPVPDGTSEYIIRPPAVGGADGIPTALRWPNGALACEKFVFPLARTGGMIVMAEADQIEIAERLPYNPVGYVIRCVDGASRGQVRRIIGRTINAAPRGDTLTVSRIWATKPEPLDIVLSLVRADASGCTTSLLLDNDLARPWAINQYAGYLLEIMDGPEPDVRDRRVIARNTANTITLRDAFTNSMDDLEYRIVRHTYAIEYDYFDEGVPETVTDSTLVDNDKNWEPNCWAGCVVSIVSDPNPDAIGQARLIESNTANELTLAREWRDNPDDGGAATYRIELPRDDKYRPDQLQGDDRIYHSVAEILPIIVDALGDDGDHAFGSAEAGEVAAILYGSFKDYLSVSSRAVSRKSESAGINDWATDGIDNDDNGVIDDENPTTAELAQALYERLLLDWVKSDPAQEATRRLQAARLVANIMDFRDADHEPTVLTQADIDGEPPNFTVHGSEGVHVTEVMATPDLPDPADTTYIPADFVVPRDALDPLVGTEVIEDFLGRLTITNYDDQLPTPPWYSQLKDTDLPDPLGTRLPAQPGWDWTWDGLISYGWWVSHEPSGTPCEGKWEFSTTVGHAIRPGWYAMRIKMKPGAVFIITNSVGEVGHADDSADADGFAYVRQGTTLGINTRLLAFEVDATGKIQFNINTSTVDDIFYTFQLLPQYVEITNTAAQDIALTTVNCGNGDIALPSGTKIRGAAADGRYPIEYGTFVVAMSEAAYERQWTLNQGLSGANNGNGIWGDEDGEDYPVYFAGDVGDDEADKMLIPHASPAVVVSSGTTVLARTGAGESDGDVGACTGYSAREKSGSPFSKTWANFDDAPAALCGSQNRLLSGGATERSNLNTSCDDIWDVAYPALKDGPAMSANRHVFPIILNRPYPTAGWLGLVPTGNDPWRTIDAQLPPSNPASPVSPEELLGTLMARALVGGVHGRINLNNPSEPIREGTLKTIFNDTDAAIVAAQEVGTATGGAGSTLTETGAGWTVNEWADYMVEIVAGTGKGQIRLIESNTADTLTLNTTAPWTGWTTAPDATSQYRISVGGTWDALLNCPKMIEISNGAGEDSGAGLFADDFEDDSDEEEEWARRYGNLLDLRTANLKYVIAGLVYEDSAEVGDPPIAQVRIEADFDISGTGVEVVQFRYVMD